MKLREIDSPHISEALDPSPMVELQAVGVRYRVPRGGVRSIKEYFLQAVRGQLRFDDFWALEDVNLSVGRGERLGVIGRNGAGKSTLLQVIAGVLAPTSGATTVRGRVAPLLQLGAGFDPELSGRENVFLNGTLLGMRRTEIKAHFDAIVDFAELADFIDAPLRTYSTGMAARLGFAVAAETQPDVLLLDEVLSVGDEAFQEKCVRRLREFTDFAELEDFIDAPLRTYSTGMAARLGFAVAAETQPDVLLLDEVLSVGDEAFQEKCVRRLREFTDFGTTMIIVTHSAEFVVRECTRAIWIQDKRVADDGEPQTVVDAYHQFLHGLGDVRTNEPV